MSAAPFDETPELSPGRPAGAALAEPPARLDPRELPFDRYQRHRLVAHALELLFRGRQAPKILELVVEPSALELFLPDTPFRRLQLDALAGEGWRLPFADGAFDAVLACDVLPHVRPDRRPALVRECRRVARGAVLLGSPFRQSGQGPEACLLGELDQGFLSLHQLALGDHVLAELPEREPVEAWLRASGLQVASLGHGNLERWLALIHLGDLAAEDPQWNELAIGLRRVLNEALYSAEQHPPFYRHLVIGWTAGVDVDWLRGLSPCPDPESGFDSSVGELVVELQRANRTREERVQQQRRLAERIASLRSDREALRNALESAACEHAETLEAQRADQERMRTAAEEAREELCAELNAERERLERVGSERRAEAQRAEEEARQHRQRVRELENAHRSQLEAAQAEANAARAAFERAQREAHGLRAELGSRWKALKRVFSPWLPGA